MTWNKNFSTYISFTYLASRKVCVACKNHLIELKEIKGKDLCTVARTCQQQISSDTCVSWDVCRKILIMFYSRMDRLFQTN